jgi:hypothetical protein
MNSLKVEDAIAQAAQDSSGASTILCALVQCDMMEPDALRLVADALDDDAKVLHELLDCALVNLG